jgi:CubicO group peptidase (beta-lactamase class C family)
MKKIVHCLLPLFLLPFLIQAQQPSFVTDSLDKYIVREMAAQKLPGLAIAIVKDGKIIVSKGYGITEIGKFQKVNDSTLFQIASCSKAFTATSIAFLAQQKKLSLDDSVRKFLPQFGLYNNLASQEVTVRDLLCHRIGLQTFEGDFLNWNSNLSRSQIIGMMAKEKPVYGFRAHFGYCNAAFLTAGEIIPVVTGQSWDAFVKATFFDPLQMMHTSTTNAAITKDKNACKPHTWWEGKEVAIPYDNTDNLAPAGGINSCVKDLSHWLLMQLDSGRFSGKQIVPFSVLKETRKPQIILENRPNAMTHFSTYCLGWFSSDYNGKQLFYHDGGADGFLSTVCFVPELNLGITVLVNSDNCSLMDDLRKQIIDAYMNLPYKNYAQLSEGFAAKGKTEEDAQMKILKDSVALKIPLPVVAKNFAGTYSNPIYGKMMVTTQGGKLGATFEHHPTMFAKLEYIGNNRFLCSFNSPMWGINVATFVLKDGMVESITINVNPEVDMMPYVFVKEK